MSDLKLVMKLHSSENVEIYPERQHRFIVTSNEKKTTSYSSLEGHIILWYGNLKAFKVYLKNNGQYRQVLYSCMQMRSVLCIRESSLSFYDSSSWEMLSKGSFFAVSLV